MTLPHSGWSADAAIPGHRRGFGYPLGQEVLLLRELPGRRAEDIDCSIGDRHGRQLAVVHPATPIPGFVGRDTRTVEFEVAAPSGEAMWLITRTGGRRAQQLAVTDPEHREYGRLVQTSSFWRRVHSARMSMRLQDSQQCLAITEFYLNPVDRLDVVHQQIHDSAGAVMATLTRRRRNPAPQRNRFEYQLECSRAVAQPLPALLLAALFAHYFYDRMEDRESFFDRAAFGLSRPSWES